MRTDRFDFELPESLIALRPAEPRDAARLLVHRAAWMKDQHMNYIKAAATAKLFSSKTAVEVALEAIQTHGGYGYVREYLVERYLRDAKITEIYEGTSEIQHIVIARELIKEMA